MNPDGANALPTLSPVRLGQRIKAARSTVVRDGSGQRLLVRRSIDLSEPSARVADARELMHAARVQQRLAAQGFEGHWAPLEEYHLDDASAWFTRGYFEWSLDELGRSESLESAEVWGIAAGVAAALARIQAEGLFVDGLPFENVLFRDQDRGHPFLTDPALVSATDKEASRRTLSDFGAILYFLLTGQRCKLRERRTIDPKNNDQGRMERLFRQDRGAVDAWTSLCVDLLRANETESTITLDAVDAQLDRLRSKDQRLRSAAQPGAPKAGRPKATADPPRGAEQRLFPTAKEQEEWEREADAHRETRDREAKERAAKEREDREQAARTREAEARIREAEARARAELEAQRQKAEREAREQEALAARETKERESREQAALARAAEARARAEQEAREQQEREAREQVARAEREAWEREAREQAARVQEAVARARAEQEVKELREREARAAREAKELETKERESQQRAAREQAAKEQAAKEQAAKEQAAKEQEARDQEAQARAWVEQEARKRGDREDEVDVGSPSPRERPDESPAPKSQGPAPRTAAQHPPAQPALDPPKRSKGSRRITSSPAALEQSAATSDAARPRSVASAPGVPPAPGDHSQPELAHAAPDQVGNASATARAAPAAGLEVAQTADAPTHRSQFWRALRSRGGMAGVTLVGLLGVGAIIIGPPWLRRSAPVAQPSEPPRGQSTPFDGAAKQGDEVQGGGAPGTDPSGGSGNEPHESKGDQATEHMQPTDWTEAHQSLERSSESDSPHEDKPPPANDPELPPEPSPPLPGPPEPTVINELRRLLNRVEQHDNDALAEIEALSAIGLEDIKNAATALRNAIAPPAGPESPTVPKELAKFLVGAPSKVGDDWHMTLELNGTNCTFRSIGAKASHQLTFIMTSEMPIAAMSDVYKTSVKRFGISDQSRMLPATRLLKTDLSPLDSNMPLRLPTPTEFDQLSKAAAGKTNWYDKAAEDKMLDSGTDRNWPGVPSLYAWLNRYGKTHPPPVKTGGDDAALPWECQTTSSSFVDIGGNVAELIMLDDAIQIVGGSAFTAPDTANVPFSWPSNRNVAFSDVGFRLAFDATLPNPSGRTTEVDAQWKKLEAALNEVIASPPENAGPSDRGAGPQSPGSEAEPNGGRGT